MTIEDPMEYLFVQDKSIIDQREVRTDTADFKTALRSMFRQDINVAMVGEMRDVETISTAVTAAETGHLILFFFAHQQCGPDSGQNYRFFSLPTSKTK